MIKLSFDESYGFDVLAILEVKSFFAETWKRKELIQKQLKHLFGEITDQLGPEKTSEVYASQEYIQLYNANYETFEAVDKAKADLVLASEVDKLNFKRFTAKKALQEKFFTTPQTEIKIGY